MDGDAVNVRKWEGFKVLDGHTLFHINGMCWTGTPGASLVGAPRLLAVGTYPKAVTLVNHAESPSRHIYRVEILGGLASQDPPLSFRVESSAAKTVLMSAAEVSAAYANDLIKNDYFAADVEIPIDELEMEVVVPPAMNVTFFPYVCHGWSEQPHALELLRIKEGFVKTQHGARFVVREPLLGLRYLILWKFVDA